MSPRSLLLVLSGPAGSGKSTLAGRLIAQDPLAVRCVTATTRAPRPGEADGTDYHFLPRDAFEAGVARGEFAEHAEYNGNLYGTPRASLEEPLRKGRTVVLVIEVQGAAQIRAVYPGALGVFVLPPTPEALRARLAGRGTESPGEIERRLAIATAEVDRMGEYDAFLVNDDLEQAAAGLVRLVKVLRDHAVRGNEPEAWRAGAFAQDPGGSEPDSRNC